jgi:UrcA family protein
MTTRFSLFRSTLAITVATAATLLTIVGSAAPAAAAEGPRTIAIDISGIDLASPAGHARIEAQIGRAARSVCSTGDDRGAANAMARRDCIKATVARAMPDLDSFAAAAREARTAVADAAPAAAAVQR